MVPLLLPFENQGVVALQQMQRLPDVLGRGGGNLPGYIGDHLLGNAQLPVEVPLGQRHMLRQQLARTDRHFSSIVVSGRPAV